MITLVQVLSFYILPFFIGELLTIFFFKRIKLTYCTISKFILGSLFVFIVALVWNEISKFFSDPELFIYGFLLTSFICAFIGFIFFISKYRHYINWCKKDIKLYIFYFIYALIIFGIWKYNNPYSLNWDLYEHQTLVNTILQGRFSYFTTDITDTFIFNSYSSLFHIILALSQSWSQTNILLFWQAISFSHLFLTILVSYLFCYEITRSKNISVGTAILSGGVFEPQDAYSNLFFLPQTFIALVFLLAIAQLFSSVSKNYPNYFYNLLLNVIFFILVHYLVGVYAAILYICSWFYLTLWKKLSRVSKVFIFALYILIISILVYFSYRIDLSFLNSGEAKYFTISILEKWDIFRRTYGFFMVIFLPFGLFAIIRYKITNFVYISIVVLTSILLLISNFPYILKLYTVMRAYIHIVLSIGIYYIIYFIDNKLLRSIAFGLFIISILIIFIINNNYWKQNVFYRNIRSNISINDINAALFLKKSFSRTNAMIISDPSTSYILEALSGVNSPGGAYMSDSNRRIFRNAIDNKLSDINQIKMISDRILDKPSVYLLVISKRTFLWYENREKDELGRFFNIWNPEDLSLKDYVFIRQISQNLQSEKIYENPSLVVYKLSHL